MPCINGVSSKNKTQAKPSSNIIFHLLLFNAPQQFLSTNFLENLGTTCRPSSSIYSAFNQMRIEAYTPIKIICDTFQMYETKTKNIQITKTKTLSGNQDI